MVDIVIAEDEKIIQAIYSELLADKNELVFAEDGLSCIDIVNTKKPDLLILDVMMPGKNGIDICKELRKIYSKDQLPILLASGNNSAELSRMCIDAGANQFLCKIFLAQELETLVAELTTE